MKYLNLPHRLERKLRQFMVYIGIFVMLFGIVLLFHINVLALITITFLLIVGSFSKIYKRFTGTLSVGFEFITPITILFAYKIGIVFALVSAFIMLLVASFIAGKIDFPAITSEEICYLIISLIAAALHSMPFVPLAVAMVILRNLLMYPIAVIFNGRNFIHMIIVAASNLFLNIIVVMSFGNFFAGLL